MHQKSGGNIKRFFTLIFLNILVYLICLFIDSFFTAIESVIKHTQNYNMSQIIGGAGSFFAWGLILFIWFALPAIILFNIIVFSRKALFKQTAHFILLGALLGCLSFAVGGGLSFENRFDVVIGTIHYAVMGGIYGWVFYRIIIVKLRKKRQDSLQTGSLHPDNS